MEIFSPLVGRLGDTLTGLRSASLPGMSSDEWDAFTLGYWAGAMALAINLDEDGLAAADVASRVEAELSRIEGGSKRS